MTGPEADRIAYLVAGFLRQTLSETEHDELDAWMTASPANQRLFEELTNPHTIESRIAAFDEPVTEEALARIKEKLQISEGSIPIGRQPKRWLYAAASVALLAGVFVVYTLMNRTTKPSNEPISENPLQPGGNYALLVLANGDTVNLHDAQNGLIDSSSGSEVMKTAEGQLSYENPEAMMIAYHTLSTPVGGQFSVTLPDGSRVWLNSSSKLRYPVAFTGKERVVELEGEGFFDIKKHLTPSPSPQGERGVNTPFVVKLRGGADVEVVGTKFNINTYTDEQTMNTTLIEGRVIVGPRETGADRQTLLPNQQARVGKDGEIEVVKGVDTEEVIAWKNGRFRFRDEKIETIMRQVGRWYGAEIVYEGKVDYHFNATLLRSEPIERLLEVLEETGRVRFRVEGRKIVVSR